MIGDALLALSAMQGLGSPAKQSSYIRVLIRCMSPPSPLRVRHAALRIISDAREELASYTSDSMPQGVDAQLLDQLSCALVTAAHPSYNQTVHDSGPNTYFHNNRDERYVSLVFALTTNEEWCQRLARDGHLKRCISLVDEVCKRESWFLGSYLPVIFGRIDPSGKDLPFSPAQDMWRLLIGNTWNHYSHRVMEHDYINAMPALVAATRLNFPDSGNGVPREWLTDLIEKVHQVLVGLLVKDSNATPVRNGKPDSLADAALSSVQGLYVDLSRIIELMNTL
ncbi:hypothetical protein EV702DRAFT_1093010 [Suillus placidus]|uniref:Uncharacterized protein n=1 Tax=Suillus placidus TaxID=48579 RepID=A0A9P6ZZB4_9AGAM|nr:hypothetical protein EV702DRAFT_1093010 [Suillus placidus]